MPKTVVAAALGECVHVAGIANFLQLAERAGWRRRSPPCGASLNSNRSRSFLSPGRKSAPLPASDPGPLFRPG